MSAPELTPELKRDLQILNMRNYIDPKRHYKKSSSKELPRFFQVCPFPFFSSLPHFSHGPVPTSLSYLLLLSLSLCVLQIGRVVEGNTDFFSSRMTRKERQETIVDELLQDAQTKSYLKRKADEINEAGMNKFEKRKKGGKKHRRSDDHDHHHHKKARRQSAH